MEGGYYRQRDGARERAGDESNGMPDTAASRGAGGGSLAAAHERALMASLEQQRPRLARTSVSVVALVMVGVMCGAAYLVPAERLSFLVRMAPLLNQAARRRCCSVLACSCNGTGLCQIVLLPRLVMHPTDVMVAYTSQTTILPPC